MDKYQKSDVDFAPLANGVIQCVYMRASTIGEDVLHVELKDGRTLSVTPDWDEDATLTYEIVHRQREPVVVLEVWYLQGDPDENLFKRKIDAECYARQLWPDMDPDKRYARVYCQPVCTFEGV